MRHAHRQREVWLYELEEQRKQHHDGDREGEVLARRAHDGLHGSLVRVRVGVRARARVRIGLALALGLGLGSGLGSGSGSGLGLGLVLG